MKDATKDKPKTPATAQDAAAAILARADEPQGLAMKPVQFMGHGMFVREMSAAERDAYEADQLAAKEAGAALDNFRSRLLVRTLVDETGKRLFADADAQRIGKFPAREIRQAFQIASKLNAMVEPKEIVKNS